MREADFKRALAVRPCARSEHFALHHVGTSRPAAPADLSTGHDMGGLAVVDEVCRLGLVVPKRFARRAVTRNLVKRQGREAFRRSLQELAGGDWLLRLRRAFDPFRFVSARSPGLTKALHAELGLLFQAARLSPGRAAERSHGIEEPSA